MLRSEAKEAEIINKDLDYDRAKAGTYFEEVAGTEEPSLPETPLPPTRQRPKIEDPDVNLI